MTNKTIKDAVEHFGGVWPVGGILRDGEPSFIAECIKDGDSLEGYCKVGDITSVWIGFSDTYFNPICTKQQFEDYVKEINMKEVKFKSVPVTDMDIWDLGKAVADGGEFYDDEGCILFIHTCNCTIQSSESEQAHIAMQLKRGEITTRQPLPWYEVEGVFPCLVVVNLPIINNSKPTTTRVVESVTGEFGNFKINTCGGNVYPVEWCKPLTPAQAAKYGVE